MPLISHLLLTLLACLTLCGIGSGTEISSRDTQSSTPVVEVKGNAFFDGSRRFYIRGIAYQPGGSSALNDPIADVSACKRDVPKFKDLGLNTIRVYTVDNTADHDECMKLLSDAGIYLALDVNSPLYSINRADPEASYNSKYLQSVFATVDAFSKYDNTLLFFAGNEVINDNDTTKAAPYVKATARDIKRYIRSRKYRKIPVGYSAADIDSSRHQQATYMACGPDGEKADFFAFNDYSWCSPSSFQTSGWDKKVKEYQDFNIPIFLSEFGCNTNGRDFEELSALYSDKMAGVYSGGMIYEYSEEGSNYGVVKIDDGGVRELPDYGALKASLSKNPAPKGDGHVRAKDSRMSVCPGVDSNWGVDPRATLPNFPAGAQLFIQNGAGNGPGLEGGGSQSGEGSGAGSPPGGSARTSKSPSASPSASASASASSAPSSEFTAETTTTTTAPQPTESSHTGNGAQDRIPAPLSALLWGTVVLWLAT